MIPLLILRPAMPYLAGLVAVVTVAGWLYHSGASNARQKAADAAQAATLNTVEQGNAAAAEYRDDGAVSRLRTGSY